jgi:hypothetical protein
LRYHTAPGHFLLSFTNLAYAWPRVSFHDCWPGNLYWSGRLSTVDLLNKIGCLVKKYSFSIKAAKINYLVLYWSFPFSKGSLVLTILYLVHCIPALPKWFVPKSLNQPIVFANDKHILKSTVFEDILVGHCHPVFQ